MKNLCQGTGLLHSNVVNWFTGSILMVLLVDMFAYSFSSLIGYNQPHQHEALHAKSEFDKI